ARQHSVFARYPAFARAFAERRHSVLNGSRDDHTRIAFFDQHTAFGIGNEIGSDFYRAQIVCCASIRSHEKLLSGLDSKEMKSSQDSVTTAATGVNNRDAKVARAASAQLFWSGRGRGRQSFQRRD